MWFASWPHGPTQRGLEGDFVGFGRPPRRMVKRPVPCLTAIYTANWPTLTCTPGQPTRNSTVLGNIRPKGQQRRWKETYKHGTGGPTA